MINVGTILKDPLNEYIVREKEYRSTHFNGTTHYVVECYSGPNEGKTRTVSHDVAVMFLEKF